MASKMNSDEKKRIEKLRKEDALMKTQLTYTDLHLLLRADAETKNLIRAICGSLPVGGDADRADAFVSVRVDETADELAHVRMELDHWLSQYQQEQAKVLELEKALQLAQQKCTRYEKQITSTPPPDLLRQQLAVEMQWLSIVSSDDELRHHWLANSHDKSEAQQLVRLLCSMADWAELLVLWDKLAQRCKNDKRAASTDELRLLEGALMLHNLRYSDRSAQLLNVDLGNSYDHTCMSRGTPKGSKVVSQWMPGLQNPGGELVRQALVELK